MAKPCPTLRLPVLLPLPPPSRRPRRAAALLLTLAVLAAHVAALRARPQPVPPVPATPAPTPALQLRVMALASPPAPAPLAPAAVRLMPRPPLPPLPTAPPTPGPKPGLRAQPAPGPTVAAPSTGAASNPAPQLALPPPEAPARPERDAAPDWPRYATTLPPAATRHYLLQRGGRSATARLHWAHDAQGYELSLMAEGGDLDGLGAASRGRVGAEGLVPQRHVERRRGRDVRATNFDLPSAQLRGSGGGEPHPWPAGGQDRLSWLLQLAAVLQADARLAQPGARVVLAVAGPRGPAAPWVFTVRGTEALTLADGRSVQGLALERAAAHPYDLQVEAWLDPADHHLPLRLRLAAPPGDWESVWLLQSAAAS